MGKHQTMGGKNDHQPDPVVPEGFDPDLIWSFFAGSRGKSQKVLETARTAQDSSDNGIGRDVSAVATAKFVREKEIDEEDSESSDTDVLEEEMSQTESPESEAPEDEATGDETVPELTLGGFLSTDEDDILLHAEEHHDESDGDDSGIFDLENVASGKPTHAGGGGKGGGKGKNVTTDEPDDPAPEPVLEPTQDPEPVVDAQPEPAPQPAPEPAPEPTPEPILEPIQSSSTTFGWLDTSTYLSGGDTPLGFNIELKFIGSWSDTQKAVAAEQAEYLSDIIHGDLADYGDIDDVRIEIDTYSLDGAGGTWGLGGWSQLRADNTVAKGGVYLDPNDLGTAESWGMLDELFMHEMLHAIGFGTTWDKMGLVSGNTFIGENAMNVYGSAVPIDGNGHLSESVGNEMGTTKITNNAEPITDLTIAILQDMGLDAFWGDPVEEEVPEEDMMLV